MVMVHDNEEHMILQYLSDLGFIKKTVEYYNIKAGNLSGNLRINLKLNLTDMLTWSKFIL